MCKKFSGSGQLYRGLSCYTSAAIVNLWGKQPEENKAIIIVNLIYAAEGWDWEQGGEWSVGR